MVFKGGDLLPIPCSILLKTFLLVKCNYVISDRELLVIMDVFAEWRPLLCGTRAPVRVLLNHANLINFIKK